MCGAGRDRWTHPLRLLFAAKCPAVDAKTAWGTFTEFAGVPAPPEAVALAPGADPHQDTDTDGWAVWTLLDCQLHPDCAAAHCLRLAGSVKQEAWVIIREFRLT